MRLDEAYEMVLKSGADITIGHLSIGTVNRGSLGSYYQVHCEYTPCKYSEIYKRSELDGAIDKFIHLKQSIENDKRRKSEIARAKEQNPKLPPVQPVR